MTASSRDCCAGTHWLFAPLRRLQVDIVSQREPWLTHEKLDLIIRSEALAGQAAVLNLQDTQRTCMDRESVQ